MKSGYAGSFNYVDNIVQIWQIISKRNVEYTNQRHKFLSPLPSRLIEASTSLQVSSKKVSNAN